MQALKTIQAASASMNEHNDCVVRALSLTTGIRYQTMHEMCRVAGRPTRCGMQNYRWIGLLAQIMGWADKDDPCPEDVGYKRVVRPLQPNGSRYTMRTVHKILKRRGKYIIGVNGHVAAYVNGQILDWTDGRRHIVKYIIEVKA